ncbi:MAG: sigma-54-dependent Fis family transcriptional regulator [Candidatus Delongbacteria bacterium]|nr:sigma-54-dependent Fis family transcriptional regulator [Candidatus Delongbacteria bacterium]MBN2836669.1 sigma-54-dependent Fis family transcriptional regulator [Candidatus Delongbacteria bacterium]
MNILIVDDVKENIIALSDFLDTVGYNTYRASNGVEALKIVDENDINLVISDIRMPEMDGFTLLETLKKSVKYNLIPIILVTAFGDIENAVNAMKNGAYDYLLKPIDINELYEKIKRIEKIIQLDKENRKLKEENSKQKIVIDNLNFLIRGKDNFNVSGIISEKMKNIYRFAEKLHNSSDTPVLLEGETGTGKEVLARAIHNGPDFVKTPFVAINCAAIPESLFESEIFGYEAGAFTGGNPKGQIGKIEIAENGTLFLDEIGEISSMIQAKLLRVIQEKEYYRIGGKKPIKCNVRFVCSTNINLERAMDSGHFRKDLFYRFSAGHIKIPPLRERKEDVLPLAEHFLKELRQFGKTELAGFDDNAKSIISDYFFPGNVRQLKNTIERIALMVDDTIIKAEYVEPFLKAVKFDSIIINQNKKIEIDTQDIKLPDDRLDLNKLNLKIVEMALLRFKYNKTETANYLGIPRTSLYGYIKRLENI